MAHLSEVQISIGFGFGIGRQGTADLSMHELRAARSAQVQQDRWLAPAPGGPLALPNAKRLGSRGV
jgi:hypothetical protein